MGLFGSIFHAIGSVAKGALSVATHGISDKVLEVLKGRGANKQVLNSEDYTQQQQAMVNKALSLGPGAKPGSGAKLSHTESRTATVLRPLKARYATQEVKRMPAPYDRAADRERAAAQVAVSREAASRGVGLKGAALKAWKKAHPRRPSGTEEGPWDRENRVSAKKSRRRGPPSGGLDLARIAAMWRAAGKPGSWLDYIKAHKDVRKA